MMYSPPNSRSVCCAVCSVAHACTIHTFLSPPVTNASWAGLFSVGACVWVAKDVIIALSVSGGLSGCLYVGRWSAGVRGSVACCLVPPVAELLVLLLLFFCISFHRELAIVALLLL